MLPKERRLNLAKDFKWLASGRKFESKYLKIFIKEGDNLFPKIGIAVSSKIFKNASLRNRARRLTSAALEDLYGTLPGNANILTLPKAGITNVKSTEVLLDAKEALKKAKLI